MSRASCSTLPRSVTRHLLCCALVNRAPSSNGYSVISLFLALLTPDTQLKFYAGFSSSQQKERKQRWAMCKKNSMHLHFAPKLIYNIDTISCFFWSYLLFLFMQCFPCQTWFVSFSAGVTRTGASRCDSAHADDYRQQLRHRTQLVRSHHSRVSAVTYLCGFADINCHQVCNIMMMSAWCAYRRVTDRLNDWMIRNPHDRLTIIYEGT